MRQASTTLVLALMLTACALPSEPLEGGDDADASGSSSDGHDSTTGLGGSGPVDSSSTTDPLDTDACEPIECPEPPPPDSCILPEGGTSCQAVAYVGAVICNDAGFGDLCWPVIAAQYVGFEGLALAAEASLLCDQPEAAAFCAAPPVGALPWATCTMVDVASCEANAAAAGIVGPEVTPICDELVGETF